MTAEIYLNREQEEKFFTIYRKRDLNCDKQELIQDLFNEALTANYLLYGKGGIDTEKADDTPDRLVCIEFIDEHDDITDEEKAEIMQEIYAAEENEA